MVGFLLVYLTHIKTVGPNEVLVISGRVSPWVDPSTGDAGLVGFRLVSGARTFYFPVLEQVSGCLSLEIMTVPVSASDARTLNGELVAVDSVAQVKIGRDNRAIAAAVERFLSKSQDEIAGAARETILGHLRTVLNMQTVEQSVRDWDALAMTVQDVASPDLLNMGLYLDSFIVQDVRQA
jgi:uncharacterized membrane protein YqiK